MDLNKDFAGEANIPDCAVHDDFNIKGFFGPYRWLSNMYPCPVFFEGRGYSCSEAAYQASKFDTWQMRQFELLNGPEAKKLGKSLSMSRTKEGWMNVKLQFMTEIVFNKFLWNIDLQKALLKTFPKYLEEANYWRDSWWGTYQGKGENHLGQILMKVRQFFRPL